ncbi:MAG: histidine kinase [Pseudohongiella sp.]|nr:MAG: histidine kinase [Pseudohongiella sp.]
MHTLQQILNQKETDEIWSVTATATVFEAIQVMADKRAGALLVMDGGKLEGIISERDYAREVILKGRGSKQTLVGEIMSTNIITVSAVDSVQNALELMTEHHIRHLPIVDDDKVAGVVSIGDLVKDVISVQQTTIEQLENYIRS